MKNSGCNIDSVIVDKSIPTGKAVIQVAESGENAIILYPGTNHCISNQELQNLFEKIVKKNWIVCQNELGTQTTCLILEMGFQKGSIVCFNPAPCSMDLCESIDLKHVDILLLNSIESSQIASQLKMDEINKNTFLVQMMNEFTHLKIAVVTLGEKGAIASFRDNDSISTVTVSPSRAVKVVDTTGAGDTFVGYFLAHLYQLHKENDGALHDQNSIQEAMTIAILASGLACESFGAMSSIPTYESVYSYIKS
jgi:ribokinase